MAVMWRCRTDPSWKYPEEGNMISSVTWKDQIPIPVNQFPLPYKKPRACYKLSANRYTLFFSLTDMFFLYEKNMKAKIIITVMLIAGGLSLLAQPLGTSPIVGGAANKNFWSRQGNSLSAGGLNNIMGFRAGSNSQVWFQTNGNNRMMMNLGAGASA